MKLIKYSEQVLYIYLATVSTIVFLFPLIVHKPFPCPVSQFPYSVRKGVSIARR